MQPDHFAVGTAKGERLGRCRTVIGAWRPAILEEIRHRIGAEGDHGLQHRHVEPMPFAVLCASCERCGNRQGRVEAADTVRHGRACDAWTVRVQHLREEPRHGLRHGVVGRTLGVRAVRTKAGDVAIDEAWVALVQNVPAEAQASQDIGAEVFDQDVGMINEAKQQLASALRIQISRDTTLASIVGAELRTSTCSD